MSSWESYVRKVVPYVPGEQPQEQRMIKLNTNENPYPPAPGVVKALREMNTDLLRGYIRNRPARFWWMQSQSIMD